MGAFVIAQSVVKRYTMGRTHVYALRGVDLEIQEGEAVAIMGPSGSGKSTLLYLIGGLDRSTSGRLVVGGRDLSALDENSLAEYRRKVVGFVFQSFNLISSMTAIQNVMFPMLFARVPRRERKLRAARLLTAVGLGDRLDHKPVEMSGGEQQRVALARALANRPRLLLADEPTGNLDTKKGREIMELLLDAHRKTGMTLIVVTHDPEVAAFAERTIRLRDGVVWQEQDHRDAARPV